MHKNKGFTLIELVTFIGVFIFVLLMYSNLSTYKQIDIQTKKVESSGDSLSTNIMYLYRECKSKQPSASHLIEINKDLSSIKITTCEENAMVSSGMKYFESPESIQDKAKTLGLNISDSVLSQYNSHVRDEQARFLELMNKIDCADCNTEQRLFKTAIKYKLPVQAVVNIVKYHKLDVGDDLSNRYIIEAKKYF